MSDNAGFAATTRSLLNQLVLSRATELARAGRYEEAEKILSADGGETEPGLAALDLLARMRAQQGRLAEAEKLWERALRLDPSNIAYLSARRRAAALRQHPWRRRAVVAPIVACVVVGVLAWMWLASGRRAESLINPPAPSVSAQVSPTPTQTDTQSPREVAVSPLEKDINVAGVTLIKDSGVLLVSFDDGLFERGLRLRPDARQKLTELGRKLKPYAATIAIEIVGMTDDLPVRRNSLYPDNASLGMERAHAVYGFLRSESGLGAHTFTISSSEQATSLPNTAPVTRTRNRTVILRISTR